MSEPKRIQRKRTKGWQMPPNTVYVGRPTQWGNEFRATDLDLHGHPLGAQRAVELYAACTERWWDERHNPFPDYPEASNEAAAEAWFAPLRGKNLACWCPLDQPCHADVLLALANRP